MANSIKYKDLSLAVGDMITLNYRIKEGDKERQQLFQGILLKIVGSTPETKMITVRKISNTGVGVEKIVPLISPHLTDITIDKKSLYSKAKLYFVRELSGQQLRYKLYRQQTLDEKKQTKAKSQQKES